jgi:membrane protease YdiL (CAAX protease family)
MNEREQLGNLPDNSVLPVTTGDPVQEPQPLFGPVLFGFIVLLLAFFAYQILGGLITFLLFGFGSEENMQGMRLVTMIAQFVFLLAPAIIVLRLQHWSIQDALRLRWPRILPLLAVVIAVIALQFVVQVYVEAQQYVLRNYLLPDALLPLLDEFEQLIEELYGKLLAMHSPVEAVFVWLVVAVTPGICEEVLFRGTVQSSFERGMRLRWAFLLSGVIFSLFHLNPVTFVPLAMLGVFFAVITWRGRSLGYAMVGHITNNTLAVVALYFFRSESMLPTDGAGSDPSATALAVSGGLGLLVFAVSLGMFWKLTRDHEQEFSNTP